MATGVDPPYDEMSQHIPGAIAAAGGNLILFCYLTTQTETGSAEVICGPSEGIQLVLTN